MKNLGIHATDGDLGGVKDFYFDDKHWTIRYLVVDTRKWLPGKKVLLSPISFDHVDISNDKLNVFASKEEVKNAPHKNEDKPVSKQVEMDLADYYGWPLYWGGLSPWRGYATPTDLAQAYENGIRANANMDTSIIDADHHLRSINEIKGDFTGYDVTGLDGEIGKVSDLVIDDYNWKISYLVVETSKILTGKFTLISPDRVKDIQWDKKEIFVDITERQAKQDADFNPTQPIPTKYEERLYQDHRK